MPPKPLPVAVLVDDDPVLLNVLRLAGLGVSTTNPDMLDCTEGMSLDDAKAACYMWREEFVGEDAVVDNWFVSSPLDGWAENTLVMWDDDVEATVVGANSQPVYGTWRVDELAPANAGMQGESGFVLIRGFSYDMYGSAGQLLDMLGAKMKMQFDFNDTSGNYARSQKFAQTKQSALDLYRRARPKTVDMRREDTPQGGGTFWGEVWHDFASQDF